MSQKIIWGDGREVSVVWDAFIIESYWDVDDVDEPNVLAYAEGFASEAEAIDWCNQQMRDNFHAEVYSERVCRPI